MENATTTTTTTLAVKASTAIAIITTTITTTTTNQTEMISFTDIFLILITCHEVHRTATLLLLLLSLLHG